MNVIDKIAHHSFDTLLADLRNDTINYIEYGDNDSASNFLSALRIRWIGTLSGVQYAVRLLTIGREGSGIYFQPNQLLELKLHLAIELTRYEAPQPSLERLRELRKLPQREVTKLSFYGGMDKLDLTL